MFCTETYNEQINQQPWRNKRNTFIEKSIQTTKNYKKATEIHFIAFSLEENACTINSKNVLGNKTFVKKPTKFISVCACMCIRIHQFIAVRRELNNYKSPSDRVTTIYCQNRYLCACALNNYYFSSDKKDRWRNDLWIRQRSLNFWNLEVWLFSTIKMKPIYYPTSMEFRFFLIGSSII